MYTSFPRFDEVLFLWIDFLSFFSPFFFWDFYNVYIGLLGIINPLLFFFFIFLVPVWIISNVLSSGSLSLFTLYSSLLLNLSIEFFQISYFILQLHDFCLVLFTKFSWNFHFVHCSSELTEHFCEVFFEKILR